MQPGGLEPAARHRKLSTVIGNDRADSAEFSGYKSWENCGDCEAHLLFVAGRLSLFLQAAEIGHEITNLPLRQLLGNVSRHA